MVSHGVVINTGLTINPVPTYFISRFLGACLQHTTPILQYQYPSAVSVFPTLLTSCLLDFSCFSSYTELHPCNSLFTSNASLDTTSKHCYSLLDKTLGFLSLIAVEEEVQVLEAPIIINHKLKLGECFGPSSFFSSSVLLPEVTSMIIFPTGMT